MGGIHSRLCHCCGKCKSRKKKKETGDEIDKLNDEVPKNEEYQSLNTSDIMTLENLDDKIHHPPGKFKKCLNSCFCCFCILCKKGRKKKVYGSKLEMGDEEGGGVDDYVTEDINEVNETEIQVIEGEKKKKKKKKKKKRRKKKKGGTKKKKGGNKRSPLRDLVNFGFLNRKKTGSGLKPEAKIVFDEKSQITEEFIKLTEEMLGEILFPIESEIGKTNNWTFSCATDAGRNLLNKIVMEPEFQECKQLLKLPLLPKVDSFDKEDFNVTLSEDSAISLKEKIMKKYMENPEMISFDTELNEFESIEKDENVLDEEQQEIKRSLEEEFKEKEFIEEGVKV